jgi:hypothetical protein
LRLTAATCQESLWLSRSFSPANLAQSLTVWRQIKTTSHGCAAGVTADPDSTLGSVLPPLENRDPGDETAEDES